MEGFFSGSTWAVQKTPLALLPECGKCQLFQHCKTPFMPVSGQGRRRVLIVAEAPGEHEDARGIQLVGNAGLELVRILHRIGVNMRKDCWLDNAIICRPMDENGENRTPVKKEIDFCRPNLSKTLFELKPDVIIPMGKVAIQSLMALAWKDGEVDDAGTWVGWTIPCVKLNTWICPSYHPSFLLHAKEPAAELHVTRHLRKAFTLPKGRPWPSPPDWKDHIRIEMDPAKAAASIRTMMAFGKPLSFDYETTTLKPDGPHAEIICCSICDGFTSMAFPWIGPAVSAMRDFLVSDVPKYGFNLQFEDRWSRKKLGVAIKNWRMDGMIGTHWSDCRHGICSLKFQAFVRYGAEDYDSHIESMKKSKTGNTPNRLKEVEPELLYTYCGYDSLFEYMLASDLEKEMNT